MDIFPSSVSTGIILAFVHYKRVMDSVYGTECFSSGLGLRNGKFSRSKINERLELRTEDVTVLSQLTSRFEPNVFNI